MAKLKITQVRSRIGASSQINQSVEHSDSVIIKGMLERVKHLVVIEQVK